MKQLVLASRSREIGYRPDNSGTFVIIRKENNDCLTQLARKVIKHSTNSSTSNAILGCKDLLRRYKFKGNFSRGYGSDTKTW